MPIVELPAAEPALDAVLEEVADVTTQPEYVYLSRVVDGEPVQPNANMPTVEFPTAVPSTEAADAAVAEALTQPE